MGLVVMGQKSFALVMSSKEMHPGTHLAKDKYNSNYYDIKRRYAEEVCDDWRIISPEHGLLHPEVEISGDVNFKKFNRKEVEEWGINVATILRNWFMSDVFQEKFDSVHLLIGKTFYTPFRATLDYLRDACDVNLVYVFEGTRGTGEQQGMLRDVICENIPVPA